jgi:hypothetical protein
MPSISFVKAKHFFFSLLGADMVVFLEHEYRLVTTDSIEEKIMKIQESKLEMSNAIVNTDNSTMFSMGTDRLLDIFKFRSESGGGKTALSESEDHNLDALIERYAEDYASLSVEDFVRGFN